MKNNFQLELNDQNYFFSETNLPHVEKWIRIHFRCAVGLAVILFIMEIVGLYVFPKVNFMLVSEWEYVRKYIVMPSIINLFFCGQAFIVRKFSNDPWKKACNVSLLYVVIVSTVYTVHMQFPSISMGFCAPILLSIIYGNRKITSITFAFSLLSKFISDIFITWDTSQKLHRLTTTSDYVDFVISLISICLVYGISLVIIKVELEKEKITIQNRQENLSLQHKTMTDPLTGIWNRAGLRLAFDQMEQDTSGKEYILCMIDMDRFKQINDTYGHASGDRYLKDLAHILNNIPNSDAFRFGGDEFCILFSGCLREDVYRECLTIQERFASSPSCLEIQNMSISIGIAVYYNNLSPSEFFHRADEALYAAKRNRGSILFFDERF